MSGLTPCAKIIKYINTPCAPAPGGVARIGIADATMWDFTQAAPVSGVIQPYTAITDLGSGDQIYGVQFTRQKAKYTFDQKNTDGITPSYTHKISFEVPNINMLTAQWANLVDVQGYCCGVLVFIFLNSGAILVMGEGSVNGAPLTVPFYTYPDGGKGDSGAKFDDPNTYNATVTGMYNRPLIQYTGSASALLALFA